MSLKMKKRKGISLVEVMMAFVLIGFLVLMVSGAVTSSYQTAAALQKLPELYYGGQQEIEDKLNELEKKVTKKYLCEKELHTAPSPDPAISGELEELNEELEEECEKISVNLFGKNVVLYQFEKECEVENVGRISLYAGTASGVRLERPVPVIENVSINVIGRSVSPDITNAFGEIVSSEVRYSETNREYCYTELYQWYVSVSDVHSVYYSDGTPGPDELQHGMVMPVYPGSFSLVTSERTSTITLTEDYAGKFVFCMVTPLSINGKMGESVMSNLIYVSDLPGGLSYRAVIDPSLMVLNYDETGRADVPLISSTSAASGAFTIVSGCPTVDLNGAVISEKSESASRFLHFEPGDLTKSSNSLAPAAGDKVFAVVRLYDEENTEFLSVGDVHYGTGNCESVTEPTESGWSVITIGVGRGTEYRLGGTEVDIAELIIVSNPGSAGTTAIKEYLMNKYSMN